MTMKKRIFLVLYQVSVLFIFSFCLFSQNNLNDKIHIDKKWDRINELKASFFYYPTLPVTGQEIRFFDASSGNPDNKYWNFGDGHISTEKNPIHAYNSPNIYYVSLQIMKGDAISIENRYILVRTTSNTDSQKPKADFIFEPENPQVGVPVRFYDKSSGNPDKRIWQFGYFSFSFLKDPVKTFLMNKKYAITLTVKNQYGEDKCTKYIDIQRPPKNIIVANSCSLKDVQAAIAQANPGDTVVVPDGTVRWTSPLIIDKGIILKAATPGGVTIINDTPVSSSTGYSDPNNHIIAYTPSSQTTGQPFRLSGFIFDGGGKRWTFLGKTNSATLVINQFRIDHCTFKNGYDNEGLNFYGEIYGVIDNCTLYGVSREFSFNEVTWNNMTFDYGSANNRYYEDNIIYQYDGSTTPEGGLGGRYCFRHNTFYQQGQYGVQPWFDMHGNMGTGGNLSTMGVEIYENIEYANNKSCDIFDHRGGKALIYNNTVYNVNGVEGGRAREEYNDNLNPPATNPAGQPQHVSESYYWGNIGNGNKVYPSITQTLDYGGNIGIVPRWDVHCFKEVPNFNGSSGMGVGLLSQRPASCTTEGVAWWATDENKLYRWHNGKWELYYVPYTYPHPLRTLLGD